MAKAVLAVAALLGGLVVAIEPVLSASAAPTDPWTITTVAGGGTAPPSGVPATEARLAYPQGVASDLSGNLYIGDYSAVRKVAPNGTITTVAGPTLDALSGFSGDGGPATAAKFGRVIDVAVDSTGNVFVADYDNHRVRRVDTSGIITTVAGSGPTGTFNGGYGGDGGPATAALLNGPVALTVDPSDNLYVAELYGQRVRRVDHLTGRISTVAGTGIAGFGGDGGPATAAQINYAFDIDSDAAGNLYIADSANYRIRKVDQSGTITTVAGDGSGANSGDGGPALAAGFYPSGVAVQGSGNIFIADVGANRVRRVDTAGTILTVAGTGAASYSGDNGPGTAAGLTGPTHLDLGAGDDLSLYIADSDSQRIRRLETSYLWMTDAPDPVTVGESITYKAAFSGYPTATTGVTVTDPLPPGVAFLSASATQGSCAEAGGMVTCALGDVAKGAVPVVTMVVRATTAGVTINKASVRANEFAGGYSAATDTGVSAPGCARVITKSTTLASDIGPCGRDGVVITANGVTLDLGGHRIFGFAGRPGDGTSAGIRLPKRYRVTVRNGTVSDFDAGVAIYGGGSNIVIAMTIQDNLGPDNALAAELGDGIYVFNSSTNSITANTVVHNGIFDGIGVWGPDADGNRVEANTVTDTVGPSDRGPAGQGIIVNGADTAGGTISATVVSNNTVRRNGSAGIANINNTTARVVGNVVEANGFTNYNGNGIGVQMGPGARTDASFVRVENNQVHGNAESGIKILSQGNKILSNNSSNNAVKKSSQYGQYFFDLHNDIRGVADCGSNTWSGNTWGSGGYNPACTATGGTGPALAPASAGSAGAAQTTTEDRTPPARRPPK